MGWLKNQVRHGVVYSGWKNILFSLILIIALYLTNQIYEVLNHGPNLIFMKSYIDDLIPIIPPFVIPYVSLNYFIYASLIAFLCFRIRIFKSVALSMIVVWFVSYTFYFFAQSFVLRPHLTGEDIFTKMIINVYSVDNPYNDFPSLHTSLSALMAFHWIRVSKVIGIPVVVWTVLIVASTVLVKQHYIADLVIGIALSFAVSRIFLKYVAKEEV
ncbi:phosphatase PAP2 family protein [Athalassotoga saccharophila]|uniref:phosphatase PAP2 family protein n=1 Tax=Athalassotoga saccharophila TaxID=1441386 RepID=UPI00137B1782|nr:phosphatase PAP2 family protein [Athalassotoga saccharophila]BBJ27999.1 hypothetical protein ATHSA_0899 [Athalassotoga saccharophila]